MLDTRSVLASVPRPLDSLDYSLNGFAVCEIGRGWRLTCPASDAVLVHFVLRGEGVLNWADQSKAIKPNDIILAPKGVAKAIDGPGVVTNEITAGESCAILADGMVAFRAHQSGAELILACGVLTAPSGVGAPALDRLSEPLIARVPGSEALEAGFRAMLAELTHPGPGAWLVAESLMKQCFVLLVRDQIRRHGEQPSLVPPAGDPRLMRAAASILANPGHFHTVASLARDAGMSRSSFAELFTDAYGETPLSYVQAVRLRTAARILEIGVLPVKAIAASVGYASRSHFSRAFKARYGVDPSAYRQRPPSPRHDAADAEAGSRGC